MKIVVLSAANSVHTVKWVNSLSERGHNIFLIFKRDHAPLKNTIDNRVKLIELKYGGGKGYYLNALQLSKEISIISPDVIHVHYASGYGTLARVAKIRNYLLSVWGSDVYDFPYRNKINSMILKKNVKAASFLASTSECMALQLKKVMKSENLKVEVTPFGIDLTLFDASKYKKEKQENVITIGIVKSLEKVYCIDDLILAVKYVLSNIEDEKKDSKFDIKLKIYGEGSQKETLQQLVQDLRIENHVDFCGRVNNQKVPDVLSEFDVFCATSKRESFGVAVIEAMAMELPVVVTDADGFKEVVGTDNNGIIVKKENPNDIARGIEKLILSKALREELGKNGRKRVEAYYDWNKNVDKMEEIYKSMIGGE